MWAFTKNERNSQQHLLSVFNYQEYKLLICGDLKVVGLIVGLQGGYKKYPCFLSFGDKWLKTDSHDVQSHHLIEPNEILPPP